MPDSVEALSEDGQQHLCRWFRTPDRRNRQIPQTNATDVKSLDTGFQMIHMIIMDIIENQSEISRQLRQLQYQDNRLGVPKV